MDLIGTAALPASLAITYYLIYRAFVASYSDPATWLPTAMLLAVIFLPGLAIIFTNFKFSRVGWMLLYLLVLPVWQFILPLYAFWRFDDFSWGATR
jgi:chitin synthase